MPVVMLVPHVPVRLGDCAVQHRVLLPAVVVGADHDSARRYLSAVGGGSVSGLVGFGGAIGGAIFGVVAGFLLDHGFGYGTLFVIVGTFHLIGFLAILCLGARLNRCKTPDLLSEIESHSMKITEVRTRVVQWEGKTVRRCLRIFAPTRWTWSCSGEASMGNFAFHGWVLVEIFTDAGLVGLGNAALSPRGDEDSDRYLPEAVADWRRSVGHGVSVAADVPPDDGFRAQGRRDDGDLARSISRCGTCWERSRSSLCIRLLGGRTKEKIPVYASRLYTMPHPRAARGSAEL